jgi:ABC-type multidrug transport system fused ATPase/permease subunit
LILDEATSALDNETEREIVEHIKRLHRLKTMIVIAHRFSTVVNCDRIIKLEHGQITEQGSSEEIFKIEPHGELQTPIVY